MCSAAAIGNSMHNMDLKKKKKKKPGRSRKYIAYE